MEIMHYLLRQVLDNGIITEDQSYLNFKELVLRHAVYRPPHSLAIFTLEDIKKIDLYAQDTFFAQFDLYKFSLTFRDQLLLSTVALF